MSEDNRIIEACSRIIKWSFPVKLLQVFFFCITLAPLEGQQANTMYLIREIPQTNYLNPAVQPGCKYFIGLPLINTVHLDYSNSSFTFEELTANNNLQLDQIYSRLHRMNMVSSELQAYFISLGYRFNNNYFSFSISDRANVYTSFSKKLIGLILYGNDPIIGDMVRFNNTRANATYYREYSAGWAFEWDRFTSMGVKAKLLFGKGNFNTGSSRALLGTDGETFALTVKGDVKVNSSFPMNLIVNTVDSTITSIDFKNFSYFSRLMNPRNVGLAADFGIINKFRDELTLSASIIDLGMIFWTDELNNVGADLDFLYEGVSEGADFSTAAYFRDLSDSITTNVIYDVTHQPYVSALPTQVFLGGEYHWQKNIDLGLVFRSVLVNRRIKSSLTASIHATLMKRVQTSLSWSYMNNSIMNVGGAIAYTGGGFQIYAASDNLIGFINPFDSRTVNLRFGMNLMLGCPINYNKIKEHDYSMIPCPSNQRGVKRKTKKR